MDKTTASVAESVNSAVSVPAVETIGGQLVTVVSETLEKLGFDYGKSMLAEESAKRTIAQCDTALFDWVKGLPYVEFLLVKRHVILGMVDAGLSASENGAEQRWDKTITRLGSTFEFKRPSSTAKDAVRKAEAKAKLEEKFKAKEDAELEVERDALLEKKDSKSLKQAEVIIKEIERREMPEIEKRKAEIASIVKSIGERSKALAKVGDDNARDKLAMALACLV